MKFTYKPSRHVCSQEINIEIEKDMIMHIAFKGGCHGNLQGISKLLAGMSIREVTDKLAGIKCGKKTTSCPDQLATALKEFLTSEKTNS